MILFEEGRTDLNKASYNLAMEETLLCKKDGEYFRLWQNRSAVIIGRNQNAYSEINDEYVSRNSIEVIRRITGGGAVYHDLGNLNFSYFSAADGNARIDFKRFMTPVALALKEIGIEAEISGRNDLVADGKKFSGNAQLIKDGRVLHHGTILVDSDLDVLQKVLNVSEEKLKSKAVASVRSRVVNLSEITEQNSGIRLTAESLKKHIIDRMPIDYVYRVTEEDFETARRLETEKYGTREWNYGREPEYDRRKDIYVDGIGKIEIYLKLSNDMIETCRVYGDFFDSKLIHEVEKLLIGRRYDKVDFANIIENKFGGAI